MNGRGPKAHVVLGNVRDHEAVVKLDPQGNKVWTRSYEPAADTVGLCTSAVRLEDGYVVCGVSMLQGASPLAFNPQTGFVLRLDAEGREIERKALTLDCSAQAQHWLAAAEGGRLALVTNCLPTKDSLPVYVWKLKVAPEAE